jgi:hypothetical protein
MENNAMKILTTTTLKLAIVAFVLSSLAACTAAPNSGAAAYRSVPTSMGAITSPDIDL